MTVKVRMACGHVVAWEDGTPTPVCACGERRVSGTSARAPRFRGCCEGPHAERVDLEAVPVSVRQEDR